MRNRVHIFPFYMCSLLHFVWLWTFYDTNSSNPNYVVKCTPCYQYVIQFVITTVIDISYILICFIIHIQCCLLTIYRFKWTLINMCIQSIVLSLAVNNYGVIILHILKLISTELGCFEMQICSLQRVILYIGIKRLQLMWYTFYMF